MKAEAAVQFIKPVFQDMAPEEQEKLKHLMFGEEPSGPKKKKKEHDPVPSIAWYKKQLQKSLFKSRDY